MNEHFIRRLSRARSRIFSPVSLVLPFFSLPAPVIIVAQG